MVFAIGMIADLAIALPFGAIAVLIVERSVRSGFAVGFSAGAGAAVTDCMFATVAVVDAAGIKARVSPMASCVMA